MKTYPKLEAFLNNLAYVVLCEPGFYDICAAAGIDWSWPKTFAGEAVMEFVKHGALSNFEQAQSKVRSLVSFLETSVTDLSKMPTDIESLRATYRELTKPQKAIDVANQIIRDPESASRYVQQLEVHGSSSVVTTDYEGVVTNYSIVREEIKAGKGIISIPGYDGVAKLMGGFNPARISIILGDSGFGKTNLAMNLAYAATYRMAVGYMNLEMSLDDISKRTAVLRSGRTWEELYAGAIDADEIRGSLRHEFRISDGRELHVEQIIAWARGFKRTNPEFGLLVIDYDQKMELTTDYNTQEWKAMQLAVRALEETAKQLQIHVILLAQVNSEGRISSSQRAIFTAHSVLKFRSLNGQPIIENSIKHRHAPGPRAVTVNYDSKSCSVTETGLEPFDLREDYEEVVERDNKRKREAQTKIARAVNYVSKED